MRDLGIETLRPLLPPAWGINKREEVLRLVYEIALREELPAEGILRAVLSEDGEDEANESGLARFAAVKSRLLIRRYPTLSPEERSQVLLSRLSAPLLKNVPLRGAFRPRKIYVERRAEGLEFTRRVLGLFPEVPRAHIQSMRELRRPRSEWLADFGKQDLCLTVEEFDILKPCPCSSGSVSCGYFILNLGFGCPYDCSYCYLQFYQNTPAILLYANPERFLEALDELKSKRPHSMRIGTGEFTDSLALDRVSGYASLLIPYFKQTPWTLELKTKSADIAHLLGLEHGGRTVLAWSLNPSEFAQEEEGAAPLEDRLRAAREAERAGYRTAFHFDPIFYGPGWESVYEALVERLFDTLQHPPAWISLGTFRWHRDLKHVAEIRHPESRIFLGEQIPEAAGGKFAYPERVREEVFGKMLAWIRRREKNTPVYLCMEARAMWNRALSPENPIPALTGGLQ